MPKAPNLVENCLPLSHSLSLIKRLSTSPHFLPQTTPDQNNSIKFRNLHHESRLISASSRLATNCGPTQAAAYRSRMAAAQGRNLANERDRADGARGVAV